VREHSAPIARPDFQPRRSATTRERKLAKLKAAVSLLGQAVQALTIENRLYCDQVKSCGEPTASPAPD
jgi:hypothetical protein